MDGPWLFADGSTTFASQVLSSSSMQASTALSSRHRSESVAAEAWEQSGCWSCCMSSQDEDGKWVVQRDGRCTMLHLKSCAQCFILNAVEP